MAERDEFDGRGRVPGAAGPVLPVAAPRPRPSAEMREPEGFNRRLFASGPAAAISGRIHRLGAWFAHSFAGEMADGNRFCWYVVAFALGALVYLKLPAEPSIWALGGLLAAGCIVLVMRTRTANHVFGTTMVVMVVCGVFAGSLQSLRSAAPRLDRERIVTVSGFIAAQETGLKDATRMTIQVVEMTARRLPKEVVPDMITVLLRANAPRFNVGDGIRFLAKLRPLQGPVMPGGYDFARRAFFDGRGATGYALGRIERVDLGPPSLLMRCMAAIGDLRHSMAMRIRAALPGATGAIAAAMIVGEQRGIPDAENDALRMSGLTHIISISGLHMSLVASGVFIAIRWMLALIPAIALRFPVKKWAAAGALGAATFYMLLAGDQVAAERSYLMCAIMLISVLLDRPALTMRNVGLSAIILLVRDPAQVVEPSFLMSYLAVMSLIGVYDAWRRYRAARPRPPRHATTGPIGHVAFGFATHTAGAVTSSLIATIATASVIADQFFRSTPYGVLANLLVLPVIDMVAMPAAVFACLAMPFGLEAIPLAVMGWAIDFMTYVGTIAASLPGGQGLIGRIHPWSNPLEIAGLLWLCLWHRSWRLLGLVPILAALFLAPFASRPDVLISADAMPVAVRGADDQLKVLGAKQNRFTVATWLTADAAPTTPADPRAPLDAHLGDGWTCDPLGCIFTLPATSGRPLHRIAVVDSPQAFTEDCERAAVVITRLVAPDYCRETAEVFDRPRLERTGAVALTFRPARPKDPGVEDRRPLPPPVDLSVSLPTSLRAWMTPPGIAAMNPKPEAADAPLPPSRTGERTPAPTRPRASLVAPERLPLDPTAMPDMPE